jgi:hypothetical protein
VRALSLSRLFVVLSAIGHLPGCGAGSTLDDVTPFAPPQRVLLTQGSRSNIPPASTSNGAVFIVVIRFQAPAFSTTSNTGTLEGMVDWTFPSNPLAVAWGRGDCTQNPSCDLLAQNAQIATKPKSVTAVNQPPGTYSFLVANLGTSNESISYQIYLTQ